MPFLTQPVSFGETLTSYEDVAGLIPFMELYTKVDSVEQYGITAGWYERDAANLVVIPRGFLRTHHGQNSMSDAVWMWKVLSHRPIFKKVIVPKTGFYLLFVTCDEELARTHERGIEWGLGNYNDPAILITWLKYLVNISEHKRKAGRERYLLGQDFLTDSTNTRLRKVRELCASCVNGNNMLT